MLGVRLPPEGTFSVPTLMSAKCHEQTSVAPYSLSVCMPDQHLAIGQTFKGNTLGKVRPRQFGLAFGQLSSPEEE